MVIKFLPEEEDDDSISGLSWSIGKLWDAKSIVGAWETNTQQIEEKSPEFFIKSLYKSEVENDTDQLEADENKDDMSESNKRLDK